jgi:hypothetical protein
VPEDQQISPTPSENLAEDVRKRQRRQHEASKPSAKATRYKLLLLELLDSHRAVALSAEIGDSMTPSAESRAG